MELRAWRFSIAERRVIPAAQVPGIGVSISSRPQLASRLAEEKVLSDYAALQPSMPRSISVVAECPAQWILAALTPTST